MRTRHLLGLATFLAVGTLSAHSFADSTIRTPGDHPDYVVDIEPKGNFGYFGFYGGLGFGAGVRFSINLMKNGFIPKINNNVAISFGVDWLHYSDCYFGGYGCGADYLFFPVALQWNFYVAKQWSVFGEPGLAVYHAFYPDYCVGLPNQNYCNYPTRTSLTPIFEVGGRWHAT
ncbi:MAG TPA: hypothetical protein VF316_10805, partial [Polyangiaceae bacterium]